MRPLSDPGQTDSSIISPAEVNNLVGIKPTVGLTSRALVVPVSQHQDTVGPSSCSQDLPSGRLTDLVARTVQDAAFVLAAIAGRLVPPRLSVADPAQAKIPTTITPRPSHSTACPITWERAK